MQYDYWNNVDFDERFGHLLSLPRCEKWLGRTENKISTEERRHVMFVNKALRDINQSAASFGKNNESSGISGFAERLVRTYGARMVARAVDMSTLTPLQAGWVKRWIVDKAKK